MSTVVRAFLLNDLVEFPSLAFHLDMSDHDGSLGTLADGFLRIHPHVLNKSVDLVTRLEALVLRLFEHLMSTSTLFSFHTCRHAFIQIFRKTKESSCFFENWILVSFLLLWQWFLWLIKKGMKKWDFKKNKKWIWQSYK